MKADTTTRLAVRLAAAAGLLDTVTGLGLVLAPRLTLAAMRVQPPSAEATVFVRFVGAFVLAVGATYLFGAAGRSTARLRHLFQFTLFPRAAAGGFVAVGLALGWLEPAWASVVVTDLVLVAVQVFFLARGLGDDLPR